MRAVKNIRNLYINRFPKEEQATKNLVWQTLCKDFFQRYVKSDDTVVDVGAGYCEFINNIRAKIKYAVDLNPQTKLFAGKNVIVLKRSSTNLPEELKNSVNIAFASNFFEHLSTKEDVIKTIAEVKKILKKDALFVILHPNIKYLGGQYWDFLDHQLPLTEKSIIESLELSGFKIIEVRAKFLPYTTKSRIPKWPWLISIYLRIKPAQMILGKQSLIVAKKEVNKKPSFCKKKINLQN